MREKHPAGIRKRLSQLSLNIDTVAHNEGKHMRAEGPKKGNVGVAGTGILTVGISIGRAAGDIVHLLLRSVKLQTSLSTQSEPPLGSHRQQRQPGQKHLQPDG